MNLGKTDSRPIANLYGRSVEGHRVFIRVMAQFLHYRRRFLRQKGLTISKTLGPGMKTTEC